MDKFASWRLGKTSVEDIHRLNFLQPGIQKDLPRFNVKCTQVPQEFTVGTYVFIWLGSDNNKGVPTDWKQGFKAIGRLVHIDRGEKFGDISTFVIEVSYIFPEVINRIDILREAPIPYYWCSSFPIIGLDDHSNQTIRMFSESDERSKLGAFFEILKILLHGFSNDALKVNSEWSELLGFTSPNPKLNNSPKNEGNKSLSTRTTDFKEFINQALKFNSNTTISYLRAMRTKPFLLLAGISGTGKSRIVKQMAFDSCPDIKRLRKDKTTPGNYCLVEVKPNWHDSSELMGYESQIGTPHYVSTTFVRFLAKAMLYEDQRVPFFVCLDEMNLAPVEQYFAEFLSVLESRKVVDGKITSEALIPAEIFANQKYERQLKEDLFGLQVKKVSDEDGKQIYDGELADAELAVYNKLKEQGLRIPSNLIVIGTVNMDETTHQFSRKVIDRAMTIEMNLPEDNPFMDFFNNARDLEYTDNPTSHELFLPTLVKAADVVAELEADNSQQTSDLKSKVATILTTLNEALNDTPFKIAYRVQNELMLYFHELWLEDKGRDWDEILRDSVDQILMMKVLPRVEGDEDLLEKPLASLATFCATGNYTNAAKKVDEMQKRLKRAHFTSYWP